MQLKTAGMLQLRNPRFEVRSSSLPLPPSPALLLVVARLVPRCRDWNGISERRVVLQQSENVRKKVCGREAIIQVG